MDHYELRHHFYDSSDWKMTRALKIKMNPLCERCLENGKITLTQSIHHIKSPFNYQKNTIDLGLALGIDNLMSVCNKCHGEIHSEIKEEKKETVNNNKFSFGGFMSKKRKL